MRDFLLILVAICVLAASLRAEEVETITAEEAVKRLVAVMPKSSVHIYVDVTHRLLDPEKSALVERLTDGPRIGDEARELLRRHLTRYPFIPGKGYGENYPKDAEFTDFFGAIDFLPEGEEAEGIRYNISFSLGEAATLMKYQAVRGPKVQIKILWKVDDLVWPDSERLLYQICQVEQARRLRQNP